MGGVAALRMNRIEGAPSNDGCQMDRSLSPPMVVTARPGLLPGNEAVLKRRRGSFSHCWRPTPRKTQGEFEMMTDMTFAPRQWSRVLPKVRWGQVALILGLFTSLSARADEANLVLPDLSQVSVMGGINGRSILVWGLVICVFGLIFGLWQYMQLKNLPVHRAMLEISELIYETCKTYMITQGKFIALLWVFIAAVILLYFGVLLKYGVGRVLIILAFSVIGILGSYGVAWFGIRVNTFANSRTAFAGLRGMPYPIYEIPLRAGMSIGMMLISVELLIMLCILLFIPGDYAGPCFIGFAIGESLG